MLINLKNIYQNFNKQTILKNINLNLENGSFYGLLGPNGSGKTTLIKILTQQIQQTKGSVIWTDENGEVLNTAQVNKLVGVVHQDSVLDDNLTVKENLLSRGGFYGLKKQYILNKIDELDQEFKINELMKKKYGTLSGGQKRRIDIVKVLLNSPKVLILDEPTTGIDVQMRADLWESIHNIRKQQDLTVILVTHYLEEMESIDYLITLINGENQFFGTTFDFIKRYGYSELKIHLKDNDIKIKNKVPDKKGKLSFFNIDINTKINILNEAYDKRVLVNFENKTPSLEDSYLQLLKEEKLR
ncbi:ABC transporter ATP-binding protein [Staphylococcus pasteuri]|uniref:ABC transporter ATP-binding protein n=1 Tax=Staphylococcus pasteuri TaxID=45972 RepID=UPI003D08FD55